MMAKTLIPLMICLLILLCAAPVWAQEHTIVLATDMHYLSPSLTDGGERFMNVVYGADGKLIHASPEICKAFVRDMLRLRPEAVILSGDLTLNGALESHREFAAMLAEIEAAGIPVLVIPGNHDVGGKAYRFADSAITMMPAATAEEFEAIYADFGYTEAPVRDPSSLSYIAPLTDQVWALMLDVNANSAQGQLTASGLAWAEEQLQAAQARGVAVIGVTHQNVLAHNMYFSQGVMIAQAKKLQALYRQYGVRLNLSGHTHMQHIAEAEGLTEIVTSSMALTPCYYGVITLKDDRVTAYEARPVDVAGWARETGAEDENLLDFPRYAEDFFCEVVRRKVTASLEAGGIPEEERRAMIDFAVELSLRDFTGTWAELTDASALALWQRYMPNAVFTYYLKGALADEPVNMTGWTAAD